MVGFYARADSTQPIRMDLDNELAGVHPPLSHKWLLLMIIDAQWFNRAEIQSVLDNPGAGFGSAEYKKMAESTEDRNNQRDSKITEDIKMEGLPFKLPPVTAIAGVLIRHWVEGKIGFSRDESEGTQPLRKGHL
jgi:NAD+ diphosphatase